MPRLLIALIAIVVCVGAAVWTRGAIVSVSLTAATLFVIVVGISTLYVFGVGSATLLYIFGEKRKTFGWFTADRPVFTSENYIFSLFILKEVIDD